MAVSEGAYPVTSTTGRRYWETYDAGLERTVLDCVWECGYHVAADLLWESEHPLQQVEYACALAEFGRGRL